VTAKASQSQDMPPEVQDLLQQARRAARSGDHRQVRQLLGRACQLRPADQAVHKAAAGIYMQAKDFDQAAEAFQRLWQDNPADAGLSNSLGVALLMAGWREAAHQHLSTAVRLEPESPVFRANMGKCLMMEGEWSQALEQLEAALRRQAAPAIQELADHCRQQLAGA
jgi:Flp pilus assembly protein TadD